MKLIFELLSAGCWRQCIALLGLFIMWAGPSARAQSDLKGYQNGNYYFDVQQSSAVWGQTIGVGFAVGNFSSTSAAAPFNIYVYISKTRNFVYNSPACIQLQPTISASSGDPALGIVSTNQGSSHGYINFQLPSSNPFGDNSTSFYVGMVINPDRLATETNYANDANQGSGIDSAPNPITITNPTPIIQISGSTPPGNNLNFGNVAVDSGGGAVGVQTITISDAGYSPLSVTSITTTGPPFQISNVVSNIQKLTLPGQVPTSSLGSFAFPIQTHGNEKWAITVTYDPTVVGAQTGSLTITTNDPVNPTTTVTLSGTGVAVPHLVITNPSSLTADFGNVVNDGVGGVTSTQTILLTNQGSGPLTVPVNGISLTTTQSGVWSITSISNSANFANSGFEYPGLSVGSSQLQPSGSTWTFAGRAFIESNGSSFSAPNAPDGTQAVMLQGLPSNTLGSISQVVNFPAATAATVSFQAAQRTGFPAQPIKFTVDGTQVGGVITPSTTGFQTYTTASFNVTAGTHTLQFAATDSSAEKDTFVDCAT